MTFRPFALETKTRAVRVRLEDGNLLLATAHRNIRRDQTYERLFVKFQSCEKRNKLLKGITQIFNYMAIEKFFVFLMHYLCTFLSSFGHAASEISPFRPLLSRFPSRGECEI